MLYRAATSVALLPFTRAGADVCAAGRRQAADPLAVRRAEMGAIPITTTPLADNLAMLSGPGGNVIVLSGPDGKLVVDSFVQPAWPALKQLLDKSGSQPIRLVIDSHWHFDHTDNNGSFRQAGAAVLAHANTKKRMSEAHDLLGMHFAPSPASALPTQTFVDLHRLKMNREALEAGRIPPAHTDTDIYVRFSRGNALHMGDVFFNGSYPFIDASTGGHIGGMIAGATLGLTLCDNATKIVPGHGPVGDKAALTRYRDMLATVRDRVRKLKASGRSAKDAVAARPTADFDATWGKGFLPADAFVELVYNTLK
jgi:glyoxylase-like metal-dependent hydrolase (beta-lactamase superfamily II)